MSDATPQKREDEKSDLFSAKPYDSGSAIPRIERVPQTPEELRKRLLLRITYGVLGVLAVAFAVWLYLFLSHLSEVEAAVHAAGDDGRVASIERALTLLESDGDAESRAIGLRLRAARLLAGERESAEAIAEGLAELPTDDRDVTRERGIAETYLALAVGDLAAALENASTVVARGEYADEAARARAIAAWFAGNAVEALTNARTAAEERPDAPRHVALLAELMARQGEIEEALARLDALGDEHANAAVRLARARIMDDSGAPQSLVAEHAQAVLEDEAATPHEKSWAGLLLARASAAAGDRVTARRHLDRAAESAPPGDELFTLALTEAALRIGADHLAQEVAARLPSPLSVDAGRRTQLSAELALARHDLRAASAALASAPAGARTSLARGRLFEARAQYDEARPLYEAALTEPAYRVPATVQLATMELAQGNAQGAADRVAPLLAEQPHHPDVVPVAVEAQLGLGNREAAMERVLPALAAHPEDVRLLAAKAHVQMALEQWEEALATLDSALRIEDDDADLHADRGRAARRLSRLEVAREAFDAALRLSPSHPAALLGRLELDLIAFRASEGRLILERIDAAEVSSVEAERLRGRLLTMEIAGQAGIRAMREAMRAHDGDPSIVMSLGWLYVQAEQYSSALRTFGRLTGGESPDLGAVLARALTQVRMRAADPARAAIDEVTKTLDEETLAPPLRAELHAVRARLAFADSRWTPAQRAAEQALELDPQNSEAHLVLADVRAERNEDNTAQLEAALEGVHPSSRPLALLGMRGEEVSEASCGYARRYREAAPGGQYARGVGRVVRDCRRAR